jgi:protein-tyrosine-phosphatase
MSTTMHGSYVLNQKSSLPLLAEKFARHRLSAMAKVEGRATDEIPIVLFLCVHSAGRSQMALGWFNHLAGRRAVAWSGGSEPRAEINPSAVAAMAEAGIDITDEFPKPWTQEIVQAADVVVTMGCGDACPIFPGSAMTIGSSTTRGRGVEAVRPIRDEIGERVCASSSIRRRPLLTPTTVVSVNVPDCARVVALLHSVCRSEVGPEAEPNCR